MEGSAADRYEIRGQLGKGGLGVVYRAFDSHLNREVAIKRVLVESGESMEELTANLVTEARTLSALNHPHIVTIHDVGQDADGPYLVMELLDGETLDTIIGRGPLPIADFEVLVVQMLEGLIAAQSVGLLHRDLKPANLMVVWLPSGKFQLKILDFGLAKFSRTPTTQTVDHSDSILGSIYFMAPEQFERLPLDARSDLYSTGALLYYTLTGEYPFCGESPVEVMMSHLEHRIIPLKEARPDVSDSICAWVESLMARKMEDRPANAQEALDLWNPEPVIDEVQLREVASGDAEMAAELLEGFEEELGEQLEQLRKELDSGRGTDARESARTIRGTASTLGYLEVISIAEEIEKHAQSDPAQCGPHIERFSGALVRLKSAIGGIGNRWDEK